MTPVHTHPKPQSKWSVKYLVSWCHCYPKAFLGIVCSIVLFLASLISNVDHYITSQVEAKQVMLNVQQEHSRQIDEHTSHLTKIDDTVIKIQEAVDLNARSAVVVDANQKWVMDTLKEHSADLKEIKAIVIRLEASKPVASIGSNQNQGNP